MSDAEKPITVLELKTFIDAVEFAADTDEWVPSARQWHKIRGMINRLQDTPTQQIPVQQQWTQHQTAAPNILTSSNSPNDGRAVANNELPIDGPSQLLSNVAQALEKTHATRVNPNVPMATGAPGNPVKTPNVDTSGGSYKSSFA
mgnify:CR=1 FL=1